jgi:hypothetical protein
MDLTASQRQACQALNDALRSIRRSDEPLDVPGEQDWHNSIEVACDSLLDDEFEDESDDEESDNGGIPSTGLNDEPEPELPPRQIADSPMQAAILNLLIELYRQLPDGREDKFFSPIIRFAVIASLRPNGQWLPPRRITRLLAVLLFCGREVVMALMYQRLLDDPTIRYSKWVPNPKRNLCTCLSL